MREITKKIYNHPIIRNNILFSGSSYVFRVFNSLIIFSLAARIFSIEDFGMISIFMLLVMVVYTALDFGHRILIVKEIAINKSLINASFIGNKIWLKAILFVVISVIIFYYSLSKDFWGYDAFLIITLLVAGFIRGISNLYFAIFQGLELFKNETKSLAAFSVMILGVLAYCWYFPTIPAFIYGYTIVTALQLYLAHYFANKNIEGFTLKSIINKFNFTEIKAEVRVGLIFALIVFVEIGFSSFDSFFVESQYSKLDLGYYEGFKKILIGLNILALVFGVGLFPAVTKKVKEKTKRSLLFLIALQGGMIMVGAIIFLIYFPLNGFIIDVLLGKNFAKLTTWDFHIALICIASYMRIIPNLYFVGADKEKVRFLVTGLFVLIEVVLFFVLLSDSTDIKQVIKLLTNVHVFFTAILMLIFSLYLYKDYLQINNNEV